MAPVVWSKDAGSSSLGEKTVERQSLVASLSKLLKADPYPGAVGRPPKPGQKEDIGTWRCPCLGARAESGWEWRAHLAVSSASS